MHSLSCALRWLLQLIAAALGSAALKDIHPFTSTQRKIITIKKLLKDFFFFWVSRFIKLIKHLDHDPAETENVPFIKLFGPDHPLLCKLLAPRTGEAVGRLELIAFNSHFTPAQGTSSKNQNPTDALVMPSLPQMGIGARAAAAAAVSRAGPRSLRWAPRARGNVKTPQRREEKNSPLSTFLPFFFYKQN